MKTKSKICLASFICIGVGIVLTIIGFLLGGRPGFYIDKTGVHSGYEGSAKRPHTLKKTKLDKFTSMDLVLQYADLEIVPSDGYYIEYQLDGTDPKPTLDVKNQKLLFREGSSRGFWGINFFTFGPLSRNTYDYYVTLYIPADQYFEDINLQSDDGEITIGNISAKTLGIADEYGQVSMESFHGGRLSVDMDDGRLEIKDLDADSVYIKNEYGNCEFDTVKTQKLEAELDDGDFTVRKSDVRDLRINNEYGNVKIGILQKLEKYDWDLETEYGSIEIPGRREISSSDDENYFKSQNNAENKVKIECDDGDIIITEANQ